MADQPSPPDQPAAAGPLSRFPVEVRAAHQRFLATGDPAALDTVVQAIVRDHQPRESRDAAPFPPPDSARLMADLGFDSLAIAEIVFFFEDLYKVSISNEEIMRIATVGELRTFVRAKLDSVRPA